MAPSVLRDVLVRLDGVDISSLCRTVRLSAERDEIDTSAYGSLWRTCAPGLETVKAECDMFRDNASLVVALDAVLSSMAATGRTAVLEISPGSTASGAGATVTDLDVLTPVLTSAGATQQMWTVPVRLAQWQPLTGQVGGAASSTVAFRGATRLAFTENFVDDTPAVTIPLTIPFTIP